MHEQNKHPIVENLPQYFTHFLVEWLYWARANPERIKYLENKTYPSLCAYSGLCMNFRHWMYRKGLLQETNQSYADWHFRISPAVEAIFESEGMDGRFPFGEDAYYIHEEDGGHHTHEPRLVWVREFIKRNTTCE